MIEAGIFNLIEEFIDTNPTESVLESLGWLTGNLLNCTQYDHIERNA